MAVTLRSGRELQKRKEDVIRLIEKEEQAETGKEKKCNTPKYTLVVFDMFRVFCKLNLKVS